MRFVVFLLLHSSILLSKGQINQAEKGRAFPFAIDDHSFFAIYHSTMVILKSIKIGFRRQLLEKINLQNK